LKQLEEFELHGVEWKDMDPNQRRWIGPTDHLIWSPEYSSVVVNFGKHKGTPVSEIDVKYWSWILKKDFPTHVQQLAYQLVHFDKDDSELLRWIEENL